ncbi:hypothetical protein [Stenotrophomonas maltophilia]|uniref:hypothetical protein n=1 Tax=Stenotrophomonas maltophilia TaxID=40324 RepID=UPI00209B84C5|nr:hypothetical protein [Stenotrophomonas maltophilia]MCO7473053.1 hypothetical protein [Stenotrophomonas maltophilia]
MKRTQIAFPVLLIELDTTGVEREDQPIHVVAWLVDRTETGGVTVVAKYAGFQEPDRPSNPVALQYHGLSGDVLRGQEMPLARLRHIVSKAVSIVSRSPGFTAKKLHALVPDCLDKRWYVFPDRIQNWTRGSFSASERMKIMTGQVENVGVGRCHALSELLKIDARAYELVFDEDGPPAVTVKLGRHNVLEAFPEAMLACQVGTRFRLHGKEGYDFITGYCDAEGPAFRQRAFRLANTPASLALAMGNDKWVYLNRIEGLTYHLGLQSGNEYS